MDKPESTPGERHLRYWSRCGYEGTFVYVLDALPLTPVKVGYTNNVPARIAALQTGCPYPLRVRYVIPASQTLETWLHQYMRACRLCGEWFDGPAMEDHLANIEAMADAIKAAHNEHASAPPPDFADFVQWIPARIRREAIRRGQRTAVVQRFVEPNPVPAEEAEERLHAHWMRPARAIEKNYAPKKW